MKKEISWTEKSENTKKSNTTCLSLPDTLGESIGIGPERERVSLE